MKNGKTFRLYIEPTLKLSYEENSIRDTIDYFLQVNCADGHITVSWTCLLEHAYKQDKNGFTVKVGWIPCDFFGEFEFSEINIGNWF